MKKIVFFLLAALLWSGVAQAQTDTEFPESWRGTWEGTLTIDSQEGDRQEVPMELIIAPRNKKEGIYRWQITYRTEYHEDVRDYELRTVNKGKGEYIIDERNSIEIVSQFWNNALYSVYQVHGNLLYASYTLKDGVLYFDITACRDKGAVVSGGEELPSVKAFRVVSLHHAELKRKK